MLRKLVSALSFLAVAALTFGQSSPASATGFFSSHSSMTYERTILATIPMDDQSSIMLWDNYSNGGTLQSGRINLDGTLTDGGVIADAGNNGFDSLGGWTKLPDGTIAVTWEKNSISSNVYTSTVYVAYSSDGMEWTQPVSPFDSFSTSTDNCIFMEICPGYRTPTLTSDSLGTVAINVPFSSVQGSAPSILVKTTQNGVSWSSTTSFAAASGSGINNHLVSGLSSGGFIEVWTQWDGSAETVYFSRTVGLSINSWIRPVALESGQLNTNIATLVQTSPNSIGYFFVRDMGGSAAGLYREDFNTVTKSWGAKVLVQQQANSFVYSTGLIASYRNGRAVVASIFGIFGEGNANFYLTEVTSATTQTTTQIAAITDQDAYPIVAAARADGSTYVSWAGQYVHPVLAVYKNGTQVSSESIPNGFTNAYGNAAVSPNGNIFFEFDHYLPSNSRVTQVFQGAIVPQASAFPTLSGQTKVGKNLTVTIPTFTSPSGIGTTQIQWYSCASAVPIHTTSLPVTCSPIAKATSAIFKITSKQRGKYLTAAISNQNSVGTAKFFTVSAVKAK